MGEMVSGNGQRVIVGERRLADRLTTARRAGSQRKDSTVRRFLIVLVLMLLWPAPSWAQPSLLEDVKTERAKYGPSMQPSEVAALLNAVALKNRATGWGLLRKGAGNSCPINGTYVSCDILVNSISQHHFDVLTDAENTALPQWNDVGLCVLGPSSGCDMSNFLAPFDTSGGTSSPNPNPSTGGTSSGDVDALLSIIADHDKADADRAQKAYDQSERMFADLTARLDAIQAGLNVLQSRSTVSVTPLPGVPIPASGGSTAGSVGKFIVKYVLPAVGGMLAGAAAQ